MLDIEKLKADIARVKEITGKTEPVEEINATVETTTETTTIAPIVEEEVIEEKAVEEYPLNQD